MSAFSQLAQVLRNSEDIDYSSKVAAPKITDAILKDSARAIAGLVRKFLVINFNISGVKSATGNLLRAISNSKVWYEKGRLRYSLESSEKVMTYANSINYGRVNTNTGLGAKAKKALKKSVLKKNPLAGSIELQATGGGATVVPPMKFYYLTGVQVEAVVSMFQREVQSRAVKSQKS
jgi:hypothetical protein